MSYKLIYKVGKQVVQEWTFNNKNLAYWMKSQLLFTGRYQLGKFIVTPL